MFSEVYFIKKDTLHIRLDTKLTTQNHFLMLRPKRCAQTQQEGIILFNQHQPAQAKVLKHQQGSSANLATYLAYFYWTWLSKAGLKMWMGLHKINTGIFYDNLHN